MPGSMRDRTTQEQLSAIKESLAAGLEKVDPYHRLRDRPVRYELTAGQTLEITFRDVPSIGEAEVLGVKKLLGGKSFCTVSPQTRERLTVRFVVPLR
ncbi:MAG TPA: hypothetical protein VMS64_21110 [Candidatus Methylomirabilis sp.]|nr:hypothetical protein [Candidatus Methylomirabilis sp.]